MSFPVIIPDIALSPMSIVPMLAAGTSWSQESSQPVIVFDLGSLRSLDPINDGLQLGLHLTRFGQCHHVQCLGAMRDHVVGERHIGVIE